MLFEGKPVGTPDAGAFWKIISDYKVKSLFTAPTAIRAIKKEDPDGKFFSSFFAFAKFKPTDLQYNGLEDKLLPTARGNLREKFENFDGEQGLFPEERTPLVVDRTVLGEQKLNEKGEFDPEYDPKTINSRIRQILNIFEKKVYIGYTATPFANIFIHHEKKTKEEGLDLFPKDYIIDLPIPSNHSGLEKIFNIEKVDGDVIEDREIDDNYFFNIVKDNSLYHDDPDCAEGWIPPRHNRYHIPKYEYKNDDEVPIPPSLREAIMSFILTSACRNFRGYVEDGKSMLIHCLLYTSDAADE